MPTKGFFASLFDVSFTSFVTTKIIKFLYVLTLVALGLAYLAFVIAAFQDSAGAGVAVLLVLGPLAFLFYAVYTRVFLEFIMAVFRIMETNTELVFLARGQNGPSAPVAATVPPPTPGPASGPTPGAPISDDGHYWWDGSAWRPVPGGPGGAQSRTVIDPD